MTSSKLDLVVLPVALLPADGDEQAQLVGYRPGGTWLRQRAASAAPAVEAAELLRAQGPQIVHSLPGWEPRPEAVTFVEHSEGVTLVFTAAVPITSSLLDADLHPWEGVGPHPDWVPLLPQLPAMPAGVRDRQRWGSEVQALMESLDPLGRVVLDHWRQQVEETTAAFDLLPRFFTTPQLRSIYDAIWGNRQDAGNFHKWIHVDNAGTCVTANAEEIGRGLDDAAQEAWRGTPMETEAPRLSMRKLAPTLVGTSPLLGAVAGLAPVALASAAAGGLVAYQSGRNPGKQPQWYTRTRPGREVLKDLYSPRPLWLLPGTPIVFGAAMTSLAGSATAFSGTP